MSTGIRNFFRTVVLPRSLLCAGVAVTLAACSAGSLLPTYADKQVYIDSTLAGIWCDTAQGEGADIRVDGSHYVIDYRDHDGRHAPAVGILFRIGKQRVLDVTTGSLPDSVQQTLADMYWFGLVTLHGLYFLDWTAGELTFVGPETDKLKHYVQKHPESIPHLFVDPDSMLILTAPPDKLQRFAVDVVQRQRLLGDTTYWNRCSSLEPNGS